MNTTEIHKCNKLKNEFGTLLNSKVLLSNTHSKVTFFVEVDIFFIILKTWLLLLVLVSFQWDRICTFFSINMYLSI